MATVILLELSIVAGRSALLAKDGTTTGKRKRLAHDKHVCALSTFREVLMSIDYWCTDHLETTVVRFSR